MRGQSQKFINAGPNGLRRLNPDEEEKLSDEIRQRQQNQSLDQQSKKRRKYDPDLEMTFSDFCRIMGFDY